MLAPLLLLTIVLAQDAAANAEEPFKVTLLREGDRLTVQRSGGAAVVVIESPRGIGEATLERRGDAWPKRLLIALRLRGLESFGAAAGEIRFSAAADSHGGVRANLSRIGAKEAEASDSELARRLRFVRGDAPLRDGETTPRDSYFEIDLPPALFEPNPGVLRLSWIDFYRG